LTEPESGDRAETCGFCGDPLEAVAVLVRGRSTAICDDCIQRAMRSLREMPEDSLDVESETEERCAMCGGRSARLRSGVEPQPAICLACIALATESIQEWGIEGSEDGLAWLRIQIRREKSARRRRRWSWLAKILGIRL
jgi:hypothetical protein